MGDCRRWTRPLGTSSPNSWDQTPYACLGSWVPQWLLIKVEPLVGFPAGKIDTPCSTESESNPTSLAFKYHGCRSSLRWFFSPSSECWKMHFFASNGSPTLTGLACCTLPTVGLRLGFLMNTRTWNRGYPTELMMNHWNGVADWKTLSVRLQCP